MARSIGGRVVLLSYLIESSGVSARKCRWGIRGIWLELGARVRRGVSAHVGCRTLVVPLVTDTPIY